MAALQAPESLEGVLRSVLLNQGARCWRLLSPLVTRERCPILFSSELEHLEMKSKKELE